MGGSRPPFSGPRRRTPAGANGMDPHQGSPAMHMPRRRRLSPTEQGQDPGNDRLAPAIPAPVTRRRRERLVPSEQGQETRPSFPAAAVSLVPEVPPVSETVKPKPVSSESLLESIVKLVNSILTFKGK